MVEGGQQGVKRDIIKNSKGWSDFDKILEENRNPADVERFPSAGMGNPQLTTWMIEQASEALGRD